MPNPTPNPEGPELRMSRVNPPHRIALHCHLRTMDLTKLGNQPCSHSIVVGMSRHFSMSPTLPLEHLPLCIRSSLVSSQSRASRMTSPKWKVILSFPRWMRRRGVDTMRVATLESPDLECPMTTPLFFVVQSQPEVHCTRALCIARIESKKIRKETIKDPLP